MAGSLARGEVWLVDFNPTIGHEQAGRRPAVIVSNTQFNQGPAHLVVVLAITTKDRRIPMHVAVNPPEGGLKERSYIMCDQIRTVSLKRLVEHWGTLSERTIMEIEDKLGTLLDM